MDREPILAFWSQYSDKTFCVSWKHKFSIERLLTGKFGSSRGGSTLWLFLSPHKPVSMGCLLVLWQVRNPLFLSFLPLHYPFSAAPSLVKPGVRKKKLERWHRHLSTTPTKVALKWSSAAEESISAVYKSIQRTPREKRAEVSELCGKMRIVYFSRNSEYHKNDITFHHVRS